MLQEQVETVNKDKEMMKINEWNLKQDLEVQYMYTYMYMYVHVDVVACIMLHVRDGANLLALKYSFICQLTFIWNSS